ncbi:phosphatidate cytidylyltransferase [Hasllibacter halocynthiae]|uniref:Phosphatidate cytidylyltransferase n=1 Tax=Hasllibacter halocynthiae TaxID=595589 RepID=A0A2T0X915_9RHOB|nr:phosphatidate cytidylyltransferase [Hasllibacter halocynthiae]PRY95354.1 phosphatidate cytidylyltransferase [Hasllibacter halocynthiae]
MIDLWLLFLFAFGCLTLATVAGGLMRRRAPGSEFVVDWNARVEVWWGMVVVLGLAMLAGFWGVLLLFAFLSFAALREFVTIAHLDRADHWAWAAVFFLALPVQYGLIAADWYGLYSIFLPVYGLVLAPVISVLSGRTKRFLARIGALQMAMMVCIYCVSHVPALVLLDIPGYEGRGVLLVAFLVLVTQGSDVLQYVFGRLYGRHPIAPALSPRKTWEGFWGGTFSAAVLGAMLWWITPFSPLAAALLAFVSVLLGFLSGLVMSAIKRDRGIKDWGHAFPGHGGFLDRMDSVVFAAPVFFHLVRYGWAV